MTKETGGNAFPHENHLSHRGMSLRDYFAAQAVQGWLATFPTNIGSDDVQVEKVAQFAYEMADALIRARNQ